MILKIDNFELFGKEKNTVKKELQKIADEGHVIEMTITKSTDCNTTVANLLRWFGTGQKKYTMLLLPSLDLGDGYQIIARIVKNKEDSK